MSFTDYLENKILDHVFNGVAYTPPAGIYAVLFTVAPSDAGGGTESAAGSAVVSFATASGGAVVNDAQASWTSVTDTIVAVGLKDAATGGNLLSYKVLATSKTYNAEPVNIAVGDLTQTLD